MFDDNYQIVRNPMLRPGYTWTRLFTSDVWAYQTASTTGASNYYRPLQMVTYRITETIAGLNPLVFHGANLLFHLCATLAAYFVLYELTKRAALAGAAALLFALHPMHSEAVIWISALTEVGCALSYFLSFYCFVRAFSLVPDEHEQAHVTWLLRGDRKWFACALLFFGASLLWKEMALTLPIVVALYAFYFSPDRGTRLRRAIVYCMPFCAVLALYVALRLHALGYFARTQHVWALSPWESVLSVTYLAAKYWAKLVIPVGLNAFHVFHPVRSIMEPRALASQLLVASLIITIVWLSKREKLLSFAGAWVFVTLLPVLNVRAVGENVFAERYLYIPSLGFCLVIVLVLDLGLSRLRWRYRRVVAVGIVLAVGSAYAAQVVVRIPDWADNYALFTTTAAASPESATIHNSLAQVLRETADLAGSEREYLLGMELANQQTPPNVRQVANSYVGLAAVYTAQENYGLALQTIDQGLAVDPSFWAGHTSRAIILVHLQRTREARDILLRVLQARPNDEVVLNWLGIIALTEHQYNEARAWFEREQKILPQEAGVYNNLGEACQGIGRDDEAQQNYRRAVQLNPGNPQFRTNLAIVLIKTGSVTEAKAELLRVLTTTPSYELARATLTRLETQQQPVTPDRAK